MSEPGLDRGDGGGSITKVGSGKLTLAAGSSPGISLAANAGSIALASGTAQVGQLNTLAGAQVRVAD